MESNSHRITLVHYDTNRNFTWPQSDTAFEKNMFPLLFPAHFLPHVGSDIYIVTEEQHQEEMQIKNNFFLPVLVGNTRVEENSEAHRE